MFSYAYHSIPEELGMEIEFTKKDGEFIGSCEYDEEEQMAFVFVYLPHARYYYSLPPYKGQNS
jgi:predicted class III extradiol MEMO1 family dioxygenase